MFSEKAALRIPGPSPVPPEVTRAMTHSMIGHRSADFSNLLKNVEEKLRPLFGTNGYVAVLAGTGTGGLEASIANLVQPGDGVLSVTTGNFGDRFADIAKRAGAELHTLTYEWGTPADPADIDSFLTTHDHVKVVLVTHCETSTGVLNDVKAIAQIVRNHDAYLIVDAVSSLVGAKLLMDEWQIDMVVTGSQKALALPPGLALIGIGERASKRMKERPVRTLYFDLTRYEKDLSNHTTPWTPPVSLVYGLHQSLTMIEEEGLENGQARHLLLRDMTRAAMRALNLPLLVADDLYASPTVTTVSTPDFDADAFRKILKNELHVSIAGGQKQLSGKIFRIGHMGYVDVADMLQCISAIEIALYKIGHSFTLGAGIKAAEEVFLRA